MKNENKKMLKVVYFDEGSAIDYIDIYNGGVKKETEDKKAGRKIFGGTNAKTEVKTGILFKALEPFIKINLEGNINGEITRAGERVLRTTISNTVLTDYINIADNDKKVNKLKKYTVFAYHDSISFMKMYTPYFNMIKLENENINFSTIDETLEKSKGFYELIAENKDGEKKILRFNIKAFRNNYNLVDLTKMNLTFYSIEVGTMDIGQLNIKNEFDLNKSDRIITAEDILSKTENEGKCIPFYDVVLAGIIADE
ncbi:hypothetical protein FACS1894140_5980 [Spirochaetia bacterium]|nr:hypothetical protein FACS1894140_5980 [Spirochaetia bacterium]